MLSEADEKFWRRMRLIYDRSRWIIGGIFAVYFLPNLMLFGQWTRISPADYVSVVQSDFVPIIKAIKEYQRDHGKVPEKLGDLVPNYVTKLPPDWQAVDITPQYVIFFDVLLREECVEYLFSPPANGKLDVRQGLNTPYQIPAPTEGWYMMSNYGSGQIPLPAVTIAASTRPTTTPKL